MSEPSRAEQQSRTGAAPFISGVVEGFYGRPWTMEQRTELFKREQKWGLNSYLYAPKDDYKHRMYWRDLYSAEEAEQLVALISAAKQHNVDFIYAISPGLDITFSNPKEVATLKRKLDQVKAFGCRSFSLLFDDIEREMCGADKRAFSSFAHAQVDVTNQVYQHLGEPDTFLFCPTDYCAAFCTPSVSQSSYLLTVGEKLLPGINILWTGPKVVSHKISVESIDEVTSVLKRAPVIWDNIHANDYDPQRLFLGPYKDRPTELIPKLRGVLTNPNCEFYPNFVAIHTLASWCKATVDVEMGEEDQDASYSPQKALTLALADWLQEFQSSDQPGDPGRPTAHLKKESSEDEPMQTTDLSESCYVPGPEENPLYTAEPLTLDDLKLLSDLFYLPYEHGSTARTMLQELHWLKSSFPVAARDTDETAEWRSRAQRFDGMCEAVVGMFNRLTNAPNRRILYDLYNYICDIKSGVGLARAHVKTLGGGESRAQAQLMNDDPEPWDFRGGLSGEFQRMLPEHGNRDLFRHPPVTAVYCMRPYCPEDQMEVRRIFQEMGGAGDGQLRRVPLVCDSLPGGDVDPSPGCALVLEDDIGLCGYALGLVDAKQAAAETQGALWDSVLEEFPSVISVQVLPRVTDPSPAKRMMARLLASMRSSGSTGVLCQLEHSDRRMMDFFAKLGSFKRVHVAGLPQDTVAMATSL